MFSSRKAKDRIEKIEYMEESVVGRFFVLGIPDVYGRFHIFMDGKVWNIEAGEYHAADRVQVLAAEYPQMIVRKPDPEPLQESASVPAPVHYGPAL